MTASLRSTADRRSRFTLDIAFEVQRRGTPAFFESTWHRYRDLARIQFGRQNILLVVHPDHVREVTVEKRDTDAKHASYEDVQGVIAQRRAQPPESWPNDLLSRLMDARRRDGCVNVRHAAA